VYIDVNNTGAYTSGDPVATSDSTGAYTFTGLAAGTYIVRVVPQSGYTTVQGSLGWTATVIAGQTVNGGSFGETQASGDLSGSVYDDVNRNGQLDGADRALSDWGVYIDLNNLGYYVDGDPTAYTDSSGSYSFSGLAPGTYTVRAAEYDGWYPNEGSDGYSVEVLGDQTVFGGDFGEIY
jgi:hypothetical protein